MTTELDAVVVAQAEERLRQERELFDQQKAQDTKTFRLRLAMGWTAVALLLAICVLSGVIIVDHAAYTTAQVTAATTALLVEALGLVIATWRGTIGKGSKPLAPTTAAHKRLPSGR